VALARRSMMVGLAALSALGVKTSAGALADPITAAAAHRAAAMEFFGARDVYAALVEEHDRFARSGRPGTEVTYQGFTAAELRMQRAAEAMIEAERTLDALRR